MELQLKKTPTGDLFGTGGPRLSEDPNVGVQKCQELVRATTWGKEKTPGRVWWTRVPFPGKKIGKPSEKVAP